MVTPPTLLVVIVPSGPWRCYEREALAWLRSRLSDREPYRVWSNFSFVSRNGQLYEVDALAVTISGRSATTGGSRR